MDNHILLTKTSPVEKANVLSKLFCVWFVKVCSKCLKGTFKITDFYKVGPSDRSREVADGLEHNWNQELLSAKLESRNPSLLKALRKTFFWTYMFFGIFLAVKTTVLMPIQPFLLARFVKLFGANVNRSDESTQNSLILYGELMVVNFFASIFFYYHANYALSRVGMKIRTACSSLIYRKIFRLSPRCLQDSSAGEVINLLSNDVSRFDMVAPYLHYIWITPILSVIGCTFIWNEIGLTGLVGIGSVLVALFPINVIIGKFALKLRLQVAMKTDMRIKKMAEIISGIQIIKMYAWEKPFALFISTIRKQEISQLSKTCYLRAYLNNAGFFFSRMTLFITLTMYFLLGDVVTAAQVFSLQQIFSIMQSVIGLYFPYATSFSGETLTSIRRLQDFLLLEEQFLPALSKDTSGKVIVQNIHAAWVPQMPVLKSISFNLGSGKLCAVVGPVGMGKSSLLQLLLGELVQEFGSITLGGEISYASQSAWIFSSSVRKNILFGQKYDEEAYNRVVKVCALKKDFEQFPRGDETLVGERGVTLSGGQKARVNLARAIYKNADIYLLDDPLSAVDAEVSKRLFYDCIKGYLSGKTRILVTHQLQYLQEVDHIIVLNKGSIEAQGSFKELSRMNVDFTKLSLADKQATLQKDPERRNSSTTISYGSSLLEMSSMNDLKAEKPISEEKVASLSSNLYWGYLKAGGSTFCLVLFILGMLVLQTTGSSIDIWVTFWISHKIGNHVALEVYSGLLILFVILSLITATTFYILAMASSRNLHDNMFRALLKAPMKFFEVTPSGWILSRFSRDIGIIDDLLPERFLFVLQVCALVLGSLAVISFANPYVIIPIVALGLVLRKLMILFVRISRTVKNIESNAKSPIFTQVNATWTGLTTIRAAEMESALKEEFDLQQDTHNSAWNLTLVVTQAYSIWIDLINLIFIICVVNIYEVSDSFVGLAISQTFILSEIIQNGISETTQAANQFVSVERVLDYCNLEAEESCPDEMIDQSAKFWPYKGEIEFANVFLSYSSNEPPVLKGLTFTIEAGKKIGVVGRTGAGKSSLISALFRLHSTEGDILLDGVNIKNLPLERLRSQISVIPQEPVLFSATLRYNLDPFNQFSDNEIWKALDVVELKSVAPSLDYLVQDGGCNFSVGQRQLICLARAVLRNNKILVWFGRSHSQHRSKVRRTDELIQRTIRNKFGECTVLTVAHRLNTIMDSDKIMVLDAGSMVEFDSPSRLLENRQSFFSKLAAKADVGFLVQAGSTNK